jgi:hypothetical protein
MAESQNVTDDDIIAFLCRKATRDQWERVRTALADPNSYASEYVKSIQLASANPFAIGFGELVELTTDEPERDEQDTA